MNRWSTSESASHRRTVHTAEGVVVTPLVHCRRMGGVVDLSRCLDCDAGQGLMLDAETQSLTSRCAYDESNFLGEQSTQARSPQDPLQQPVGRFMQPSVTCFAEDASLKRIADVLTGEGFGGAPVVDKQWQPVGVISLTDLVRASSQSRMVPGMAVARDAMTPSCCSLSESAELARAAAIMAFEGIHRIPIVSTGNQVVGIVTALDVLRVLAEAYGFTLPAHQIRKLHRDSERRDV